MKKGSVDEKGISLENGKWETIGVKLDRPVAQCKLSNNRVCFSYERVAPSCSMKITNNAVAYTKTENISPRRDQLSLKLQIHRPPPPCRHRCRRQALQLRQQRQHDRLGRQDQRQARTILWNEENRVKEIQDNGKSTYFLYDDAGERILKRGQHGETFYINRFYSIRNGELGTKSIYAGNSRIVSKLVKTPNTTTANTTTTTNSTTPGINGLDNGQGRKLGIIRRLNGTTTTAILPPEEKDQFFYHGDHLGSSNMITDSKGAIYQHLEYFPYGETWIEEGGSYGGNTPGYKFTGKELDPETGLYYFGARYYEPVISRWISADPALEKFLPAATSGIKISTYNAELESESEPRYTSASWVLRNYNWSPIAKGEEDKKSNDFIYKSIGSNKLEMPAARVYDPNQIHLYSYVQGNPLNRIDPLGLEMSEIPGAISKAFAGASGAIANIAKNGPPEAKGLLVFAASTEVLPLAIAAAPSVLSTYRLGMVAAGAPAAQNILNQAPDIIGAYLPGPPTPTTVGYNNGLVSAILGQLGYEIK